MRKQLVRHNSKILEGADGKLNIKPTSNKIYDKYL